MAKDVVLEDRVGGREVRGRSDVIQVGVESLGRVDSSQPLLTFLSAEAVMEQSLRVCSGPVDWLDRLEMDGSTVTRIVNGVSLATGGDLAITTSDVDAVDDLADRYLRFWNGKDPVAGRMLYASGAKIEDSLLGRSLQGSDEITESVGSQAWPDLPPATIVSLDGRADTVLVPLLSPPRGRAIYISPSGAEHSGPVEVRVVLEADDGFGCPGALVAELGWDGERILWERRYHEIVSTRRCLDPAGLSAGWWEGITVPDPVRIEESEPMVWSERDVTVRIFNGSPAAKRFIRWGLERFDAADLPLPQIDSVTFLSCESRCRGYHGLFEGTNGEVAITLCCAAETVCVDEVCSTWFQASRHTLLHELAHAWMEEHLTEEEKQEFLTLEGLDQWCDFTDPWPDRGVERAAEAIAFALSGTPASACAPDGPGPQYEDRFRLITGREPLVSCSQIAVEPTAQDPTTVLRLVGVAACAQNINLLAGR
ncbi:MAG: hypothetical protein ABR500_01665 [Dermatophilaceae bacterium]